MTLESASRISRENYLEFFHFSLCRTKYRKWIFLIFPILFVLLLLESLFMLFSFGFGPSFLVLVSLGVAYPVLIFLVWTLTPRTVYKASAKLYASENHFTWYEDRFTVATDSEEMTGSADYRFSVIWKVYETKDFFYLFITKNQSFIIPKNSFLAGTSEELAERLKSALGKNYKICC